MIIKENFGISYDEIVENLMLDPRYQYALHTTSCEEQPLSDKTLSRFRKRCYDYDSAYGVDLLHGCMTGLGDKIAKMVEVNPRIKRMDSMMIAANIRKLSRAELLYTCVAKLSAYLYKNVQEILPEAFYHYCDPNDYNKTFYYHNDSETDTQLKTILEDADYGQEKATAGVLRFYILVYKLMSCVLIAVVALIFMAGEISLPYCLTFLFCAFTVYSDLETMGNSAFLSKKIITELERLEEVTNIPQMDTSTDKLETSHYDIALDYISFGYGKRQVIHDISLEIPEHTTCAIVGPSGSGKTTLCNLIARFWDVQDGAVRIGGKDVKNYTADSILEYISMVFQNVYLFHDSIENNIKFGKPDATHEEVEAAAKRSCCHDFISALPDGYNTIIDEGGSTLSGGEKQRISIARAMLKDAPIIILDEATSSVDPENEQALLSAIVELTKNKTLISIAHRLSTVQNADQIVVINQGRVVQRGTHQSLISQEGIYRNFLKQKLESAGWAL